jgi:hypothetical protein
MTKLVMSMTKRTQSNIFLGSVADKINFVIIMSPPIFSQILGAEQVLSVLSRVSKKNKICS